MGRVAFLATLLGLVAALGWISSRHFIVRTLTDERLTYSRAILLPAIERFPASPRLQKRVIESYLNPNDSEPDDNEPDSRELEVDYGKAAEHAMQAVRLSPHNGRLWYWLAQAQEGQGLTAEAEQSLGQAARLAPSDSQVNWGLANVLVRAGKVDESVEYFRRSVSLNANLYPQAFDTLWQAGGRKLELLREICGTKPAAQLSLAQYLVEQRQYGECATLFESLVQTTDAATLAAIPQTNDVLNQLLAAEQPLMARQIWQQLWMKLQPLNAAKDATNSGLLWDGGFEYDARPALPQFTWILHDSDFARVGYDDRVYHSGRAAEGAGRQSLKLLFTGRDTTVLSGEVRQRLALEPGRRYRFEAAVKGDQLVYTEGPRLAIMLSNGVVLAQSAPLPDGTWDWQTFTFDFVTPTASGPSGQVMFFDIVRTLKLAYDPPVKGALWFDDLKLVAVEN